MVYSEVAVTPLVQLFFSLFGPPVDAFAIKFNDKPERSSSKHYVFVLLKCVHNVQIYLGGQAWPSLFLFEQAWPSLVLACPDHSARGFPWLGQPWPGLAKPGLPLTGHARHGQAWLVLAWPGQA